MISMWILWLSAIGLIVVAAWALFRSESRTSEGTTESAEDILRRR